MEVINQDQIKTGVNYGRSSSNFISDEFICQNFSEYNGSVFDESLIDDPSCIPKLLGNKISTLSPESSNLWFIGQKNLNIIFFIK